MKILNYFQYSKKIPDLPPALKLSIFEGIWFALAAGSAEYYLSTFAIFLSANSTEVGILASLPSLAGSFAQIFSVMISDQIRKRRIIMVIGSLLQAVCFLLMSVLAVFHFGENSTLILTILAILAFCGNSFTAPMWNSIIGDIAPQNIRAQFLGVRSRAVALTSLAIIVAVGGFLQTAKNFNLVNYGFFTIFIFGGICRLVSSHLLLKHPDPEHKYNTDDHFSFYDFIRRGYKSNFTKFVFFIGMINFAVNIAGPYYSVYMLKDMGISYFAFTIITSTTLVTQFTTLHMWGKLVDLHGTKKILTICSFGLALNPFFWLISDNFYYLVLIQFHAGLFWAGFTLSSSNFLFDAVSPPKRARCAAYQSVISSLCGFSGTLIGGAVILLPESIMPKDFGIFSADSFCSRVFLFSGIARISIVLFMIKLFQEVRDVEPIGHKELLFRILSVRPFSGMTVTPMESDRSSIK